MTRAEELIALFDRFPTTYLEQEVEEAITLQGEITPLLLEVLERIAANPEEYANEEHFVENYAVTLLAHFREERAHLPIIRAFSIPDEQRELIWSELLTETLPALLCRTSGGDYTHVLAMIRNRDAYEFLRAAALEGLKLGVACGHIPREKGLELFRELMSESLAEPGDYFWGSLICDLLDLHAVELREQIDELYEKKLVDEWHIPPHDVADAFSRDFDLAMKKLDETLAWRMPENPHEYMSWFACFREHDTSFKPSAFSPLKAQARRKEKERSKRKMAKKSKRKNRR